MERCLRSDDSRESQAVSHQLLTVQTRRGVARLEAASAVKLRRIAHARRVTEQGLVQRQERLARLELDSSATVALMGSWGRREVTAESDDDFMVLLEGSRRKGAQPSVEAVAEALGGPSAGAEGVFRTHVWLKDLQRKIGRDEDSNSNLTRRMLFILESVPVCGDDVHARARRALLEVYLATCKDYRPPRFLLNDVIRYWRTIAVDFESKMRARKGKGWGLRNAKLRLSRKALFAGGLLPILECYRYDVASILDYLDERMSVPPLDRIADAFADHGAVDPGVRALTAYDEFLGILNDPAKREELNELAIDHSRESELFVRITELGRNFEAGLLALLFDDGDLHRRVREYLVF